jgi:hypothetical protein
MLRVGGLVVTAALVVLLVSMSGVPALADPPPGDICGSAIVIHWGSTYSFAGDLASYANDYDPGVPGPSCTGSAAPGKDLVLAIEVGCSQFMSAYFAPVGFDGSIYIVTDCSDVTGSCLNGADAHGVGGGEEVGFDCSTSRTYYIIVDAHDAGTGGPFSLSFGYGVWDIPPGACCFPDGHCDLTHVDFCGGVSLGPCSVCEPNPCVPTPVLERSWGAVKVRYR